MTTLKLKKKPLAEGEDPTTERPFGPRRKPVRGYGPAHQRPTLAKVKAERAERTAWAERNRPGDRDRHPNDRPSDHPKARPHERVPQRPGHKSAPFRDGPPRSRDERPRAGPRPEHHPSHGPDRPRQGADQDERRPYGPRNDDRRSGPGPMRSDARPIGPRGSSDSRGPFDNRPRYDDRRPQGGRSAERPRDRPHDRPQQRSDRDDRAPQRRREERGPAGNSRQWPDRVADDRHRPPRPAGPSREARPQRNESSDQRAGQRSDPRRDDRAPNRRYPAQGRDRFDAGPRFEPRTEKRVPVTPQRKQDAPSDWMRLSKRISELGLASRREADEWIEHGWVRVNGAVVAELGARIAPDAAIEIDPRAREQQAQRVTILLHKPVGYVSGQAEDGYEPAVVLIKPDTHWSGDTARIPFNWAHLKHLAPAGRLDIDSTGLLVLTQDGRIAKHLIGEDSHVEKEYLVRVTWPELPETENLSAAFPPDKLELLRHGLSLDDAPLRPAKISWQNEHQLRFVLREGKKRQIRRMCELVGLQVTGLKRVRMGSIPLGQLPVGQWRYLGDQRIVLMSPP